MKPKKKKRKRIPAKGRSRAEKKHLLEARTSSSFKRMHSSIWQDHRKLLPAVHLYFFTLFLTRVLHLLFYSFPIICFFFFVLAIWKGAELKKHALVSLPGNWLAVCRLIDDTSTNSCIYFHLIFLANHFLVAFVNVLCSVSCSIKFRSAFAIVSVYIFFFLVLRKQKFRWVAAGLDQWVYLKCVTSRRLAKSSWVNGGLTLLHCSVLCNTQLAEPYSKHL